MMKLRKTKDLLDALEKGIIYHDFGFVYIYLYFGESQFSADTMQISAIGAQL